MKGGNSLRRCPVTLHKLWRLFPRKTVTARISTGVRSCPIRTKRWPMTQSLPLRCSSEMRLTNPARWAVTVTVCQVMNRNVWSNHKSLK